ncbi:MAG: DUF4243 domain-containing protein [Fidelibacterota bacterium]|nr:MAG: DUF4243 domain-containing protein [Candidatus Neomarinimicrobiota bacterium]
MPTAYEDALHLLAGTGPEYGEGVPNSGPIVADSLVDLGRPHLVNDWIKEYSQRLEALPATAVPISRENWRPALSDRNRTADWGNFFHRELKQASWRIIITDWMPRLASGMAGGTGFGLLRAAHAARNLTLEETQYCRAELAEGLGYWSSYYLKLPGILSTGATGNLTPLEALTHIKWQHKKRPPEYDLVSQGLHGLSRFSPFAGVINLVHLPERPEDLITETTASMARVFLSNCSDPMKLVPFMLALMVPSSLRHLIPHLEQDTAITLVRYGWQFAGAMYAIYGRVNPADSWEPPNTDKQQLIEQACSSGHEYAVMFTATCLREFALNPDDVYLAAASEGIRRLSAAQLIGPAGKPAS